jgi:SNF2 family DNA or RNA helicase
MELTRAQLIALSHKGGLRKFPRREKVALSLSNAQLGLLERVVNGPPSTRRLVIAAMHMGTGKTLAALATLCVLRGLHKSSSPVRVLFVVPKSTLYNAWRRQITKFTRLGVDDLRVVTYPRLQNAFIKSWARNSKGVWEKRAAHPLLDKRRDLVVFDESHTLRNPNTILGRAASLISKKALRVLCLTGTPVHNGPEDASGQLRAMGSGSSLEDPAKFGKRASLRKDAVRIFKDRFVYTANLADAGIVLKPKHVEVVLVSHAFSSKSAAQYNESLAAVCGGATVADSAARVKHHMLILRQLCVEPALFHKHGRSLFDTEARRLTVAAPGPKLQQAIACVRRLVYQGHSKIVVVSEFVSLLDVFKDLARERLGEESLSFDGRLGAAARGKVVDSFLESDARLLLLSLGAGAYGLNLTPGPTAMIVLDVWFNPAVHRQVEARIHRIGQTKEVVVKILVTKDSVEAAILKTHVAKEACAAALMAGADSGGMKLIEAKRIAASCQKMYKV